MSLLDQAALAFCRVWPSGLSKWAPGTCGTFEALLLAPWLFLPLDMTWRLVVLVALFVLGGIAGTRAEKLLGREDPGEVVIDELVGAWITILPFADGGLVLLAAGFVLFRFFDILKPWPIRASEDWLPGGWGIMIDDVVGGVMAMIVLLGLWKAGLVPGTLL